MPTTSTTRKVPPSASNVPQLTALLAAARGRIAEVDDALRRIDVATFGVCERCGQLIAEERLAARPFARFCMACA